MKTDNLINRGVEDALKDAQFQRKSSMWYRDLEETVVVVAGVSGFSDGRSSDAAQPSSEPGRP